MVILLSFMVLWNGYGLFGIMFLEGCFLFGVFVFNVFRCDLWCLILVKVFMSECCLKFI